MKRLIVLGCLIASAPGCSSTDTEFGQEITLDMFGEGTGSGHITGVVSSSLTINCPIVNGSDANNNECEKTFNDVDDGVVVLTATPNTGHQFVKWACSTTAANGNCSSCQAGGACTVRWSHGGGVVFEISAEFNPPCAIELSP